MSKYPCDDWSWSSRRCDPKFQGYHDANKENEPISPLSRLAEKVNNSRRWAPIPDRWHNHCEWLVNHHRDLRKRFRKTTADDRLSGVLATLKCTRERRRGSAEHDDATESKRIRSYMDFPELKPENTLLESKLPERIRKTSPKDEEEDEIEEGEIKDDDIEVETAQFSREIMKEKSSEVTKDSIGVLSNGHLSPDSKLISRSPSPIDDKFEPLDFRTSTPTESERRRREDEEQCGAPFNRSSAWKDYVMSYDPILFRSYIDKRHPKKSWRHSHQKLAARLGGKFRRRTSGRIRKPPTPKSLRISWNSLDDVVQSEGILKSPLKLPPILPCDITPPNVNDHGDVVEREDDQSSNVTHKELSLEDLRHAISDGIQAIRKECSKSYPSGDDSYAASDEREDPSELSDISLISLSENDEETSKGKPGNDLETVSSDEDIDDICRIVDKELHHDDYHPDNILSETSFDILEDLEVDSKYPPNYFRAGFADRRGRKVRKAARVTNKLDPQARSFMPRNASEEGGVHQRIVKFAGCDTPSRDTMKENIKGEIEEVCTGTKFYPSDVRFNTSRKPSETLKNAENKQENSKALPPEPAPLSTLQDPPTHPQSETTREDEETKSKKSQVKEKMDGGQHRGSVDQTVELERSTAEAKEGKSKDIDRGDGELSAKHVVKGKARRPVAHKIPVVMGRREWKPSHDFIRNSGEDTNGNPRHSVVRDGERVPQLRQVDINHVGIRVTTADVGQRKAVAANVEAKSDKENLNMPADNATAQDVVRHHCQHKSMMSIDLSQQRRSNLMKQHLAILKESHGNCTLREDVLENSGKETQGQQISQEAEKLQRADHLREPGRLHSYVIEVRNRDEELPDLNNNRVESDVLKVKKDRVTEMDDTADITKGKRTHERSGGGGNTDLTSNKTQPVEERHNEPLMNPERVPPVLSESQSEARRIQPVPLSEACRDNPHPQPLFQSNGQHRVPPHLHHPNMQHPNIRPTAQGIPGGASLYQHTTDHPRPFNPHLSAYHHHQMALRAAAMQYYSQHRHMMQVHRQVPPGFYHPHHTHPNFMNMHPGFRPDWNMPGPGAGPRPPH